MARGRKPEVRYWASRKGGGYFVTRNGVQVTLALGPDDSPNGPTFLAALEEFTKLMRMERNKGTNRYLVSALFNQYRQHISDEGKTEFLRLWESYARTFSEKYGSYAVCDLRPMHFTDWLKGQTTWNNTTKRTAGGKIMTAINWAARQGFIDHNHLRGKIDLPRIVLRGDEAILSEELMDLILNSCHTEEFREYLWLLRRTGARPGEIARAEAWNVKDGVIVYKASAKKGYKHKNARNGKDRTIALDQEARKVIERKIVEYPEGVIVRAPGNKVWDCEKVNKHWGRVIRTPKVQEYCRQNGITLKDLKPYNFRHTYITTWIAKGGSIVLLAKAVGNSVAMIEKHYCHLADRTIYDEVLRMSAVIHQSGT